MPTADLSNPILNSPYHPPEAHFEIGQHGPTGIVLPGRRPSESFIPVPVSKKKGKVDRQEVSVAASRSAPAKSRSCTEPASPFSTSDPVPTGTYDQRSAPASPRPAP